MLNLRTVGVDTTRAFFFCWCGSHTASMFAEVQTNERSACVRATSTVRNVTCVTEPSGLWRKLLTDHYFSGTWGPWIGISPQLILFVTLFQLSTRIHAAPWSLLSQTLTYMAALALCLGSLTLAVPPVYTGNHVTNKYLKWSTYAGTVLIDAPFLMLRLYFLHTTEHSYSAIFSVDGVFCAMVVKEMVFVCACVWVGLRKVSQCVGSTYLSLSLNDPDFEEYEMSVYV